MIFGLVWGLVFSCEKTSGIDIQEIMVRKVSNFIAKGGGIKFKGFEDVNPKRGSINRKLS
jgi:hypothetical protein